MRQGGRLSAPHALLGGQSQESARYDTPTHGPARRVRGHELTQDSLPHQLCSHGWRWIAADSDGHFVPRGSVLFNGTAIPRGASGRHWLRCWTTPDIACLNVAGFLRATVPTDLRHINAVTNEIETLCSPTRQLFRCTATPPSPVAAHLVVVRGVIYGWIAWPDDRASRRRARLVLASAAATLSAV